MNLQKIFCLMLLCSGLASCKAGKKQQKHHSDRVGHILSPSQTNTAQNTSPHTREYEHHSKQIAWSTITVMYISLIQSSMNFPSDQLPQGTSNIASPQTKGKNVKHKKKKKVTKGFKAVLKDQKYLN